MLTKVDDLLDDQEVARKAESFDNPQFMIDRFPRPRVLCARPIALVGPLVGTVCEPAIRCMPIGNPGAGQSWSDEAQVESTGGCEVTGVIKSMWVGAVQPSHFGG